MEHLVSPTDPIALKTLNPGFNSLTVATTTTTAALQVTTAPSPGYVLTSDSKGNASWSPAEGGITQGIQTLSNTATGPFTGSKSWTWTAIKTGQMVVLTMPTFTFTESGLQAISIPVTMPAASWLPSTNMYNDHLGHFPFFPIPTNDNGTYYWSSLQWNLNFSGNTVTFIISGQFEGAGPAAWSGTGTGIVYATSITYMTDS